MRTIILTHEYPPFRGGVAVLIRETIAAAMRIGLDPLVAAPDLGRTHNEDGLPVWRYPGGGRLTPGGVWETARALVQLRRKYPGARIWLGSYGAMLAALWLGASGRRLGSLGILFCGSDILKLDRHPIWKHLAPLLWARMEKAAVISEYVRDLLADSIFGKWAASALLVKPGLRTDLPPQPEGPRATADRLVVLTLARVHPRKGQLEVARALATLPASTKERLIYRVAGVGDAAYLDEVRRLCFQFGVAFEAVGATPDAKIGEAFSDCDLYVMASRTLPRSVEGFGMTFLEAGYYGKPVVGYDSGGIREAVVGGVTGYIVPEGDVDALADSIRKFLDSPGARETFGAAGRDHARRQTWDAAAEAIFGKES